MQFEHWLASYPLSVAVCAFGIFGNALSIKVWQRLSKKVQVGNETAALYFVTLAVIDLCILLLTITVDILPTACPSLMSNFAYIHYFIYVGHPLHYFFVFVSVLLIVAISIDRLRFVLYPLHQLTQGRTSVLRGICFIVTLSAVINIPSFFEYEVQQENGVYIGKKVEYEDDQQLKTIVFLSHCVGGVFIPWVMMLFCNIVLIVKTRCRTAILGPMLQKDVTKQLTATLIAVSFTSLILLGFQCISRCITMFVVKSHPLWSMYQTIAVYGNLAIPVKSASNIVMFFLPGSRFRNNLKSMF